MILTTDETHDFQRCSAASVRSCRRCRALRKKRLMLAQIFGGKGDLFRGKPVTGKIRTTIRNRNSLPKSKLLRRSGRRSVPDENDFQITHELADSPPELWAGPERKHRFCDDFQLKEYGGLEFAYAAVPCTAKTVRRLRISGYHRRRSKLTGPASCCSTMVRKSRRIISPRLARGQRSLALR